MQYDIADIFYSIKGEGVWTGTATSFIRLAGCNLNCDFCDTEYRRIGVMNEDAIVDSVKKYPSRRVIITGGEPLIQDVKPLMRRLHEEGFLIHLETNGTMPLPQNEKFDWIAVSPKTQSFDVSTIVRADEIKVLCGLPCWKELVITFNIMPISGKKLWLMPLTKGINQGRKNIQVNVTEAIEYCKKNPGWALCSQVHKLVGFK